MTPQEYLNVFIAFDMIIGVSIGSLSFFFGYARYLEYTNNFKHGRPLGDPTNGKLWFSTLLWVLSVVPFLNIFIVYIIVGSWLSILKQRKTK